MSATYQTHASKGVDVVVYFDKPFSTEQLHVTIKYNSTIGTLLQQLNKHKVKTIFTLLGDPLPLQTRLRGYVELVAQTSVSQS